MINKYKDLEEEDLQKIPDGDPNRGMELFDNNCSGCHMRDPTSMNEPDGPSLRNFIGKQVAKSDKNYDYSSNMRKKTFVWDRLNLFIFLYCPVKMVPGTRMKVWGMQDQQDRADLIEYLFSQDYFLSKQILEVESQKSKQEVESRQSMRRRRKKSKDEDINFKDYL
ncbi:Cytochrome c-like domain [Pseudocohnilembus persalinus]|uniref:Cytochrome c-like domain n=1 Tax=Pseudocohnilembus persalinus TaxID=266149 RepID=A0A0V0QPG4_PSEPJ|nr:Cytochrome c-like domain [Pseudocohnilembus persalinus]|eukprot:KRX04061.1 Cytochrome c-like domain [Pseudocohnilembus persalinus]